MPFHISEFGQYKSFELPDYKGIMINRTRRSSQINPDTDNITNEQYKDKDANKSKHDIKSISHYAKQEEIFKTHQKISYARELMTKNLVTATEQNTRREIINMMENRNIHHIPIIKQDIVIGIISPKDLLFKEGQETKEIMVKKIIVATEDTSINDLAKIMCAENIGCLPILNDEKVMTGLVTQIDILRLLAAKSIF